MAETRPTHDGRRLRAPFLIVNPKAYLYGAESPELAIDCEALPRTMTWTSSTTALRRAGRPDDRGPLPAYCRLAAQHMDALVPGRGMGFILPEAPVEAGARAVVLNHAEHPMGVHELSATTTCASSTSSIVCADSDQQVTAVAHQGPDVAICEPTANIGTGSMVSEEYVERTIALVRRVNPGISSSRPQE